MWHVSWVSLYVYCDAEILQQSSLGREACKSVLKAPVSIFSCDCWHHRTARPMEAVEQTASGYGQNLRGLEL